MNDRCAAHNACTLAAEEEDVTGRQGGGDKTENLVSPKGNCGISYCCASSLLEPCVHAHECIVPDFERNTNENKASVYDDYQKKKSNLNTHSSSCLN